jgi:hypothetical protein
MDVVDFVGLDVEALVLLLAILIVDGAKVVVDAMVSCFDQEDASGDFGARRIDGKVSEGVEEEEEADLMDWASRKKLNAPLSTPPSGNCVKTYNVARAVHNAAAQRHTLLGMVAGGWQAGEKGKEEPFRCLLLCVRFAAETSDELADGPRGCRC